MATKNVSWKPPQGGSVIAEPGFAEQWAFQDAASVNPGSGSPQLGSMLNWSQIPGASGFLRDGEFGDLPTANNAALDKWLSSNNYKIMDSPAGTGRIGYRWVQDRNGRVIGDRKSVV